MAAVRLDEGQEIRCIGIRLAALADGLEDLFRVLESLEPIIDVADGHQSIWGIWVLPDAQLGQFKGTLALGCIALFGKDRGQVVADPGVGWRLVGQCPEDCF